ncbi:glycosyltransferase [Eubacterium limosum]|uniref:Glycosyl transferase family 1 domain-containing protein n=1 Tax=Eubacterium limosum TaxID=1736 RepID=A0AAC9W487_EUBLI|nr:glycosyltransferase [Eubacterium limosum]ARD67076.1 hypothetical protein B2M23_16720 [Eubacterium limosum]PWW51351.1 glycosyltransferase involved in cell wall biosynthesis [Eubacterium limosum]UQZ23062.1 glycosyltransferase [Eubacterium limosum]
MAVLFAHDGYMGVINEEIYSDTYDNKIIERYKEISQNVIFLVRKKDYKNDTKLKEKTNHIEQSNFSFQGVDNFKTLKGYLGLKTIKEKVNSCVRDAEYIVARIPSDLGFLAIKYAKKYSKPYLIEVVGCPFDSLSNYNTIGKLLAPIYMIYMKKIVKRAPYVLYVSKNFLQKRYKTYGRQINCSNVELEKANGIILQNRLKKIKNTDKKKIVIGTLAAVNVKYKGQQFVIKAIKMLYEAGYEIEYQLVGGGSKDYLKKIAQKEKVSKQVKFLGELPHEKVFEWLSTIDIYIQPSLTEGLPRALIESMSLGCPALGSDSGGIPELLDKSCLFPKRDIRQLVKLIKNFDTEKKLVEAQRNFYASQEYTKNVLDQRRIDFYREFKKQT